jgi:hypothetical protein
MIETFISGAVSFIKLAPRYIVGIGLIAGFMLWADSRILEELGLYEISIAFKSYLGFAIVFSGAFSFVYIFLAIKNLIIENYQKREFRKAIDKRLAALTEDEKQILRYYFAKNTRANSLRVDDGVVQGLVAARIIYRSATIGDMVDGFAFNITDYAWEQIHKNPQFLEGTTNTYQTHKVLSPWTRI